MAEFNDIFDSNYDYNGPPTKLPAGRLEITLDPSQSVEAFELNLATAEGIARLKGGGEMRAFVNAASVDEPVAVRAHSGSAAEGRAPAHAGVGEEARLPAAAHGRGGQGCAGSSRTAADGFAYAVCAGWKRRRRCHAARRDGGHAARGQEPAGRRAARASRRRSRRATTSSLAPHAALVGASSGSARASSCPSRTSCGTTTWCATSTAPPRAAARRPCRCRACGRPTPARCRRGRAITTTTSTPR